MGYRIQHKINKLKKIYENHDVSNYRYIYYCFIEFIKSKNIFDYDTYGKNINLMNMIDYQDCIHYYCKIKYPELINENYGILLFIRYSYKKMKKKHLDAGDFFLDILETFNTINNI